MKLYLFRTVRLSIIRSLFNVHSAVVYVVQVCRQFSSRTRPAQPSMWCTQLWHNSVFMRETWNSINKMH